jgi:transposase-like protein
LKTMRCPFCNYPLDRIFTSATQERYKCIVCGKQTTVEVKVEEVAGEVEGADPDVAA